MKLSFSVRVGMALAVLALLAGCSGGGGGSIRSACLSARASPGSEACRCVQTVADQTLSRAEQRQAAQIISDPDRITRYTRAGASESRKAFLRRYRAWASTSEKTCRG